MNHVGRREADTTTRRAGALRKSIAQLAAVALVLGGTLAVMAVSASATQVLPNCENVQAGYSHHYVLMCKSGPETAVAGTDITWTLNTYSDTHKNDDHNFAVTDELAEGTTLVSATGDGWDCSGSTDTVVNCESTGDGSQINGSTITVVAHIDSSFTDDSIENCALLTIDHEQVESAGDQTSSEGCADPVVVTRVSDISVAKTGPASLVVPGEIAYDVTVTNNGPSDSDPVTFSDTLPTGTTLVSAIGSAFDCTGSTVATLTCTTLDGLANGASASMTVTLSVPVGQEGVTLENCAAVTGGDTSDVVDNDNSCSTIAGANVTVEAAAVVVPVVASPHFTG